MLGISVIRLDDAFFLWRKGLARYLIWRFLCTEQFEFWFRYDGFFAIEPADAQYSDPATLQLAQR
jgi:hypothetical protein